MKNNKKRVLKIGLICIIAILILIGLYCIADYQISSIAASTSSYNSATGTTSELIGGINPASYTYNIHPGTFEATQHQSDGQYVPIYGGYELYCINPGGHLSYSGAEHLAQIYSWFYSYLQNISVYQDGTASGWVYHHWFDVSTLTYSSNYHGYITLSNGESLSGQFSYPQFKESGSGELSPALAYVVSSDPVDSYSSEKQLAIWQLGGNLVNTAETKDASDFNSGSINSASYSDLVTEASYYSDYDGQVSESTGLNPQDQTDTNSLFTLVDSGSTYTVGPFNVSYTEGDYGSIAFAGIAEITVIGYNSAGTKVRDDIKVTEIYVKSASGQWETIESNRGSALHYVDLLSSSEYVDRETQVYPASDEDFLVEFANPNSGISADSSSFITSVSIKVTFNYMLASGEYTFLDGYRYIVGVDTSYHTDGLNCVHTYTDYTYQYLGTIYYWETPPSGTVDMIFDGYMGYLCFGYPTYSYACHYCVLRYYLQYEDQQDIMAADAIRAVYKQELYLDQVKIGLTMDLGGEVWQDVDEGKEFTANGILDGNDLPMKGITVTLYEYGNDAEPAKLAQVSSQFSTNPTTTDSTGCYLFLGLDSMKKYYVTFEYNGQIYMPTTYNTSVTYNSSEWMTTSKALEDSNERTALDKQFETISSYPSNYVSKNDGSTQIAYSKEDALAGNASDHFIEDCMITADTGVYPWFSQFIINNSSKSKNNEYSSASAPRSDSFDTSTVTVNGVTYQPIYPGQFFIDLGLWERQDVDISLSKDVVYAATTINGQTEVYTYNVRNTITDEQKANLATLWAAYTADRTNNTAYNAYLAYLGQIQNQWDVTVSMRETNSGTYYGTTAYRQVYPADYTYSSSGSNKTGDELEVYITYKITVKNNSESISTQINEIVDYYDSTYTYMNELSWVMYKDNTTSSDSQIAVPEEDYYDTINSIYTDGAFNLKGNIAQNGKTVGGQPNSVCGSNKEVPTGYSSLYIEGLSGKTLDSGEEAYVYLTFKVNKRDETVVVDESTYTYSRVITGEKNNYAEINRYSTYYASDTILPNYGNVSGNAAGIIDIDSNPGNLTADQILRHATDEFEDDTDRACPVNVYVEYAPDGSYVRSISGYVWEDKRTESIEYTVDGTTYTSVIGDGVRQTGEDAEIGIEGVTVQLVEILDYTDSSGTTYDEYIWYETTTDSAGHYEFKADTNGYYSWTSSTYGDAYIIPGNYIIRFIYGDTEATVLTSDDGGSNTTSYNGQDFKSTVYEKNMTSGAELEDTDGYYDITAADELGMNLSDAKDLWDDSDTKYASDYGQIGRYSNTSSDTSSLQGEDYIYQGRSTVNDYSDDTVTYDLAAVLASPYEDTSGYTDEEKAAWQERINTLIANTKMTAETAIIELEGEYDRTISTGDYTETIDSSVNGVYKLENIDFGLTERPKAQLEIGKTVTNVTVTLSDGSTLFDANGSATDVRWLTEYTGGLLYNLSGYMSNNKYDEYYGITYHRYYYRETINSLVSSKYTGTNTRGSIQLDMDEELMHGATITITYKLTVNNAGETDYTGDSFYYKGVIDSNSEIVTTSATTVIDYVSNNLTYRADNNTSYHWTVVDDIDTVGLSDTVEAVATNYNTIIANTEDLADDLKPGQSTTTTLVLSQLMTSTNTDDDRTYDNITEITAISNTVGRRMAYSIQGNQDPTADPTEVDSAKAEEVIVIPPTGIGEVATYIALAVGVLVILIGGIVFIKKKVLKK